MCTRLCCFVMVAQSDQAILEDCTTRSIIDGPSNFVCVMPWYGVKLLRRQELILNQYALISCEVTPENNRYEFGPCLIKMNGPFESVKDIGACPVLDQDDYIVVTAPNGNKRNVRGPGVFKPTIGETWASSKNTVQVPINCYLVIHDANSPERPVHHEPGPRKFFPEPFQVIIKDPNTQLDYHHHIEVTQEKAVHLQKADGTVILLDTPQFYMPDIGERVISEPKRTILSISDFCILKGPDGTTTVMNGRNPIQRAFFIKPFFEFLKFNCDVERTTLSTLPTFIPHKFPVRTSDNVLLDLDIRISFEIQKVDIFSFNPIDFYPLMKNYVQNDLLDKFSQSNLREFMSTFSKIAQLAIDGCSEYFMKFGIAVLDIQVLNYNCVNKETQQLLDKDIHTNVNKQNELRATQNDVQIQEQINEVQRKQKDLQVQMAQKDNEVALAKKSLENAIRLKEMEIEIQEQHKRTELLEVRRGNDLVEAEFVGRARGHEFREFLNGVDEKLTTAQKLIIWNRQVELEQAKILYTKVNSITMYPPNSDLKMFNFAGKDVNLSENRDAVQAGLLAGIGATVQSIKSK